MDTSRIALAEAADRLRADVPAATVDEVEPQALRVRSGGDLFYGPLHDAGLVSVQGLGAQHPAQLLAPRPGQRILDACAGMGVKALQLAELMQRRGKVVAADVDARQLAEIEALRVRGRLGSDLALQTVVADLTRDGPPEIDAQPFDGVLVDVPCTGLGNLARHPEIRDRRRFEDIAARADLQRALLERCLRRAVAGAPVVYAACSFEPEEGPHVVADVAAKTGANIVVERTLTPEDDGTEGFYFAKLTRA